MSELYKDKEWLRKKYIVEKLSMNRISKICGCDYTNIRVWLTKFNLKKGQEIKCINCGKKRTYTPDYVRRGGGKFCGLKCQLNYLHKKNDKGRFIICMICGKKEKVCPNRIHDGRRCCSIECESKRRIGEKNPAWNGGTSREPYGLEFGPLLREEIRKRDNYTCQIPECGLVQNGRKFSVHHIDYDKKNNGNLNLITLCLPCHMKTNYNREYWQNYFQNLQEAKVS